jgi:hypothetical protein
MLKRFRLHNMSIITLSIISLMSSMIASPIAMATSPADDDVHLFEGIQVGGAGDSCTYEDRTQNWMDPDWWRSTFNYQINYDNAQANTEAFISELTTNLEAGFGWAVTQNTNPNNGSLNMITIQTFSPTATLTMQNNGILSVSSNVRSMDIFLNPGSGCRLQNWNTGATNVSAYGNNIAGSNGYFLVASDNIIYPSGYEGPQIPSTADVDGDDLAAALELTQGTSDVVDHEDTDGDGIDDLKESQWYSSRNDVFCKSDLSACAYPNPIQKDLYVEIDWMNDGIRDYKPTTSQINTVASTFETQNITPHFDLGQYGGGTQLSTPTGNLYFLPAEGEVDFFDIKNGTLTTNAEFSADRKNIWHYMITGKDYIKYIDDQTNSDIPGSTGNSLVGDDDSIVSIQKVENITNEYNTNHPFDPPRSVDAAVVGTILHELGHNLCLSNPGDESYLRYPNQATECVYSEIDKELNQNPLTTYVSVMNYRFQLAGEDDYSHGANAPYDHDDWSAIALGINDFTEKTDPAELMFRRGGLDIKTQLAD